MTCRRASTTQLRGLHRKVLPLQFLAPWEAPTPGSDSSAVPHRRQPAQRRLLHQEEAPKGVLGRPTRPPSGPRAPLALPWAWEGRAGARRALRRRPGGCDGSYRPATGSGGWACWPPSGPRSAGRGVKGGVEAAHDPRGTSLGAVGGGGALAGLAVAAGGLEANSDLANQIFTLVGFST